MRSSQEGSPRRSTASTSTERASQESSLEPRKSMPLTPVRTQAHVDTVAYPAFLAAGTDSAPFLNAMFGIFDRARAPTGAPAGPVGPLAYSMTGFQVPFQQATFMPFMPFTGMQWPAPLSVQQSPFRVPAPSQSMSGKRGTPASESRTAPSTPRRMHSGDDQAEDHRRLQGRSSAPRLSPVPRMSPTSRMSPTMRMSQGVSVPQSPLPRSVAPHAPSTSSAPLKQRALELEMMEEEGLRERAQRLRDRIDQDIFADDQEELEPFTEGFDLGEVSGLNTTPEMDFESPTGIPSAEATSYHVMVRRAAELLDLQLPVKEIKSNFLTEVLMPSSSNTEPLLPFHEAVAEPVLSVWEKPATAPAVNRALARRYKPAPEDPSYLSTHPTLESLVILQGDVFPFGSGR